MESAGIFVAKGNCARALNDFFSDHLAAVRGRNEIPGMIRETNPIYGDYRLTTRRFLIHPFLRLLCLFVAIPVLSLRLWAEAVGYSL
jgi:hypothetical protein